MSIYVKTSKGADRMTMFEEIENSSDIQRFEIGRLSVVRGTKLSIAPKGRDWIKLFDKVELQSYFGPLLEIGRIQVATFNADTKALDSHFYPPEIYYQGDWCVYQYYYPATASNIDMRINYILSYYH